MGTFKMGTLVVLLLAALHIGYPGTGQAASYDYGDAPGYSTGYSNAYNTNPSWQRLGTSWSAESSPNYQYGGNLTGDGDDGVAWTQAGDDVNFTFTMYKQLWGRHTYDYLRVWLDVDGNNVFDASEAILTGTWAFKSESGYAYGDGVADIYEYFATSAADLDPGNYWLRARVTCDESINYNLANLTPYGGLNQGETEDWKITVTSVPEPASMLLLGMGMAGVAILGRRVNPAKAARGTAPRSPRR